MVTKGTLLYGNDSSGNSSDASEFITRLLHGSTAIHMHHLMVEGPGSYAAHTALGMYSELADLADGLAESYMGCTGQKLKFGGGQFSIAGDPIAEVQALYDYVESKRMMMGSESHIQNDVDGVCTLLASTLYKLKRLA
jgi:hypothetical protein